MKPDTVDPALLAVPFYLVTMVWEMRASRRRISRGERTLAGYETCDTRTSLVMGLGSVITVGLLNLVVLGLAGWLWRWRITDLGNGWVGWLAALVGWDFAYYWAHRAEHRVRFFWGAHVNHHSSRHYNLSTALRQPWFSLVSLLTYPPLALLGIRPWMIMVSGGCNLVYQYWVHTELIGRLPRWFEAVCNTPSHHRVHHGSNQRYLDRNYGGVLIVFDRLFGTFEPETEPVRYGLTKNIDTFALPRVVFHEWVAMVRDVRSATGFRARVGAVLGPPGWKPSGSGPRGGLGRGLRRG